MEFLHPEGQKVETCLNSISRVATELKNIIPEIDVDRATGEWRVYALEDFNKIRETSNGSVAKYWNGVLQTRSPAGDLKFASFEPLVKCCLSLAHGNADTERSFSQTGKILLKHRNSKGSELLNGLMNMKSYFATKHVDHHNFVITPSLLKYCRELRSIYQRRCDEAAKTERLKQKKKEQKEAKKKVNGKNKKKCDRKK